MTTYAEKKMAWRDGEWLVLRREMAVAPDRCIHSNNPVYPRERFVVRLTWGEDGPGGAKVPMKLRLLWSLATMKSVTVDVGLSDERRWLRRVLLGVGAAGICAGATLFGVGLRHGFPPALSLLGSGAALVVVSLTVVANSYSVLTVVAMDRDHVWLRGAKRPFLDSLPRWDQGAGADEKA